MSESTATAVETPTIGDFGMATVGLGLGVAGLGLSMLPNIACTRVESFYKPIEQSSTESRASWPNIKTYVTKDILKPIVRLAVARIASERLFALADYGLALLLQPILPYGRLNVSIGPTSILLAYAPGAFALSFVATLGLDALFLPFKVAMTRAALLPSSRPTIELFSKTERNDPTALYAHLLPSLLQTSLISTGVSLVSSGFLALLPPDSYFGLPVRFASIVVNLTQSLVMARLCAQYVGKDEEIHSVVPLRPKPYKGWFECFKTIVKEEGWWFASWVTINSALGLGMVEVLTQTQEAAQ
ncbi:hypothetical protein E3Q22_02586 [Wallemia mellicola]|uniref:Mitochondrial carrier n=1 Tax=Wallemia mellicola TaxID=1708541 RepID=A0A4T0M6M0_9BASI|nr:hypothetical protein E3Q24_03187 [Wallemia mellicola]TIB78434.1 hypothetical protein E3Q22_02586 [Wallemia mellicola]TIB84056.1 hypothetical protein E3Q21_02563 [Wallemia mellicola]TIB87215.1 hypothetical protein E3Q20_02556 [Wallemia mellicola]TIC00032.1 hypothetical protein E3Q17_02347 [Wallemia mellicola]